ncbi:MAG: hypothetical protein IPI67_24590 [Myxococcales bacterium]|nr:hypothetical protein [Myxococcales bacterium]
MPDRALLVAASAGTFFLSCCPQQAQVNDELVTRAEFEAFKRHSGQEKASVMPEEGNGGNGPMDVSGDAGSAFDAAPRSTAERIERMLRDHNAEPIDIQWARETSIKLTKDLDPLQKATGSRVVKIDCRTSSCAVLLEWNSFNAARTRQAAFVHAEYSVSCARAVGAPPDDALDGSVNPSAPYTSHLILHCGRSRGPQ